MHPTGPEVVFVGEALTAALDDLSEGKILIAEDPMGLGGMIMSVLGPRDVEGVQMVDVPAHGLLDKIVQLVEREIAGDEEAAPDGRLDLPEGDFELQELGGSGAGLGLTFLRHGPST